MIYCIVLLLPSFALSQVIQPDPGPTTLPFTTVYRTITQNGVLLTVPLIFTQDFRTIDANTKAVPIGSIGMGAYIGEVGQIRTYETSTVNNGNINAGSSFVGIIAVAMLMI